MKSSNALVLTLTFVVLTAGCARHEERVRSGHMVGARISAEFIDAKGDAIGSTMLTETAHGVLIDVEFRNLEPGWHGFHVHETGDCTAPDFKSAGEHFNPHEGMHGLLVENGPHGGDLPNIFIAADGTAHVQVLANSVTLREGDGALADADGAALVLHSSRDDYRSQPSGDSGTRIACAEIR